MIVFPLGFDDSALQPCHLWGIKSLRRLLGRRMVLQTYRPHRYVSDREHVVLHSVVLDALMSITIQLQFSGIILEFNIRSLPEGLLLLIWVLGQLRILGGSHLLLSFELIFLHPCNQVNFGFLGNDVFIFQRLNSVDVGALSEGIGFAFVLEDDHL